MKTTRLTSDGRLKMDPVFAKIGEELAIVYTLQESPTLMSLMRMRFPDGKPERLNPDATLNEFEATFTPDGRFYAFVQSRANLNLKLVIRDVKQAKDSIFDPGGGFAGMRRPSFAPDGSRVIFSIPVATGQEIASVDREGKDRKSLTKSALNSWPAFSPDGKQIAFGSSRDGDFEIYVMAADGSNPRRLTKSPGLDARPAWSPDGKRLAFTSNRDGNYEIYVMNADGTGVRRITQNTERDDFAAWHPDGKQLTFVGERDGKFDIYSVEIPIS
jgi:TolB protein